MKISSSDLVPGDVLLSFPNRDNKSVLYGVEIMYECPLLVVSVVPFGKSWMQVVILASNCQTNTVYLKESVEVFRRSKK
jgi:hypothetical protein